MFPPIWLYNISYVRQCTLMGWTTETASTYDRCDSQSKSHTEGCTTHLCLVQQVCSMLLHQFPHQVKVTTCCCHQDSCPANLRTWEWWDQSKNIHTSYFPQYICQCRPDTSVASTAVLKFYDQSIHALSVVIGAGFTLTLSTSSRVEPQSRSIRTTSSWPLRAALRRAV